MCIRDRVETENAINNVEQEKQDKLTTEASMEIIKYIKKYNNQNHHIKNKNKQNETISNVKQKLTTNNLNLTKADKSNRDVYKRQVNNNCITLNKDPTNKYQTQITNILRNISQIINPKDPLNIKWIILVDQN